MDELGGRGHCVAPQEAWCRPRVRVLAQALGVAMPQATAYSGDDADWQTGLLQNRSLFDVDLDKGSDRVRTEMRLALPQRCDVASSLAHMIRERAASVGARHIERLGGQLSKRSVRSDIGAVEPRGLLAANCHHCHVALRDNALGLQPRNGGETRDDAGRAVVVAALG